MISKILQDEDKELVNVAQKPYDVSVKFEMKMSAEKHKLNSVLRVINKYSNKEIE